MDESENKFKEIRKEVSENIENIISEEDSKLQIINRILTEVLGWSHSSISCENKHENGYSDYVVKEGGASSFLIEAKRINRLEVQVADKSKSQSLKLSGSALKKCEEGVRQAFGYASPNGFSLAVLTDGVVWVIFKPHVPNENFMNKEAMVFPSLESIEFDFSLFYDLLSRSAVNQRKHNIIFDRLHNNRISLSQEFYSAVSDDEIKLSQKSELAFDLDKVFEKFLSAMAGNDDEELLIECFVESRESRIADFSLEKMTASVLGNITTDKAVNDQLNVLIESSVASDSGGKLGADQTVFIVGPTGAGKTTFLDRFFKKTLTRAVKEKCALISVNCLDTSGNEDTILSWLTERFISIIENTMYNGSPDWNQLQALYHGEYIKRSQGVDFHLYQSDKSQFKIKFGEFMEAQVEKDREGYLIRLLKDLIQNRQILPIFIIDNTDENTIHFKQKIFQYLQSIRREVKHSISIFPVTDKSAWAFSKTDIFGIYESKSFFLPSPSPRDVFKKRADYLKDKINVVRTDVSRKSYFSDKGIKISIADLDGFTRVLEGVFVDHDFTSKTVGQLTNYNIRRALKLSQRVLTSSVTKIEDLIRTFVSEKPFVTKYTKFIDALLKGNYQLHKKGDTPEIIPIFEVDSKVRQSPLLPLRVLALLQMTLNNGRTIDERHLSVDSIISYFDALGCNEIATECALISLLSSSLVEPYDTSVSMLSPEQRLAISHKGKAHLDLGSKNSVYFYQMALITFITDKDVADSIRSIYKTEDQFVIRIKKIKAIFAKYLLEEDSKYLNSSASGEQFLSQQNLLIEIEKFKEKEREPDEDLTSTLGEEFTIGYKKENVLVVVDWYDPRKKFGFARIPDHQTGAYINLDTLLQAGFGFITEGDSILCDISRNERGIQIDKIHDVEVEEGSIVIHDCTVVRLFSDRYYGFAEINSSKQSIYFHTYSFDDIQRKELSHGYQFKAEVILDSLSGSYQIRKVLS